MQDLQSVKAELQREVPEIRTERLVLRALRFSDAASIFAYAQDAEVAKHTLWDPHRTVRDSHAFLDFVTDQFRAGRMFVWGITLKPMDRVIGTVGLANFAAQHSRAELGFALARDRWNQGITTEAAKALVAFGFANCHLNRIEAFCKPENLASARVLEKVGMKLEGVLRQHQFIKQRLEDLRLYSVLKSDPG